jgi:hypothetical protein
MEAETLLMPVREGKSKGLQVLKILTESRESGVQSAVDGKIRFRQQSGLDNVFLSPF